MILDGRIELITGPMFAGKTKELIRRLRGCYVAGLNVKIFKPTIDSRYSEDKVVTHDGESIEALPVENSLDILKQAVLENEGPPVDVVGIDEVSLFPDENIVEVVRILSYKNQIRVIMSGIDRDFKGRPIGQIPFLMCLSDKLDKLSTVCFKCRGEATLTQRLTRGEPSRENEDVIHVAGIHGKDDITYEARCKWCHQVAP